MRLFLTLAIALVPAATNVMASEARYASIFDKTASVLEVGLNSIAASDLGFPATECANSDEFVCMTSKVMVFAVPRNDALRKAWTHSGASYKVLSNHETVIFGELVKYRVILQTWKKVTIEFAYSDDRGVIGLKMKNGRQLLLTTVCGFAASSDAYGCQSKGPGSH